MSASVILRKMKHCLPTMSVRQQKRRPEHLRQRKKTPAKLSVLNGIDFRKRDENVFKQGRKKGSDIRLLGYWLGFHYRVQVVSGIPHFSDDKGKSIKVKVDEECISASSGDIVYALITFYQGKYDYRENKIY